MASAGCVPGRSRVRIGDVFRVEIGKPKEDSPQRLGYIQLTAGRHSSGADRQKGIFFYKTIREPGQRFQRLPAFIFFSNPFKTGTEGTPWVDVIEPDLGYALFHGDNRKSSLSHWESRGNAKFVEYKSFYSDPSHRKYAPPILLFTQCEIDGNRKGYRQFSGYGVPIRSLISTQRERNSSRYFTNLAIELVLFRLDRECEVFDWSWIDARRDGVLSADRVLELAPAAWKQWVVGGDSVIEICRRRTARQRLVRPKEQLALSEAERSILDETVAYYVKKKHAFEGLAAFVTERVVGSGCKRGWVTKRSGDGGIDFVCRLDLGDRADRLARAPVVVLGQAKCNALGTPIGGKDLARLVARLQRGWLGVFVTTGYLSDKAQMELDEDKYPLVIINGQKLARELQKVLTQDQIPLRYLLDRESEWYERNLQPLNPGRILDDSIFGSTLEAPKEQS